MINPFRETPKDNRSFSYLSSYTNEQWLQSSTWDC